MHIYNESTLVEQPAIDIFEQKLGYTTSNAYYERFGAEGTLGRENNSQVVLLPRLRAALKKINEQNFAPETLDMAIEQVVEELTRPRLVELPTANKEIYKLLKDGVKVRVPRADGRGEETETMLVIDWKHPEENDFFLVSQMWITRDIYTKRPDLLGFVNGLPLIFIELKAIHERLEHAYNNNLRDYKTTIPQLFWYNALIILSNGRKSMLGSITAGWEHFFEWKKLHEEDKETQTSLPTMLLGTCSKQNLLDLVENFTLFSTETGDLKKVIAKNHQFLGVNRAIANLKDRKENQRKLGVFWHTQGSGKSYSMVFFTQKVLRKMGGDWTFVIVTDRKELDKQIYHTFRHTEAVTEDEVHAENSEHLRDLLGHKNLRTIFTLIQKFQVKREKGKSQNTKSRQDKKKAVYKEISARRNIIVIADEAHRSQYDEFARNMRLGLPNAAFIGFTGTPLIEDNTENAEQETRETFGDYISQYKFNHAIADGITVPLYYENRTPEVQFVDENFNDKMLQAAEAADLNPDEDDRFAREFSHAYNIITRDDRLEEIAQHIVSHFMARGYLGKAMVVSIDKVTALRMYNKVQFHWLRHIEELRTQLNACDPSDPTQEKTSLDLTHKITFMQETQMALIISSEQNEVEKFRKHDLEIEPHRRFMKENDLEEKFKNAADPLRIVFVCAMWMTGFDVPSLSTVYLDKPLRNHTLMQTIARANRVHRDTTNGLKANGLIVDYAGIFKDLRKALAIYALDKKKDGVTEDNVLPIQNKKKLLPGLKQAIAEIEFFCQQHDIDVQAILATQKRAGASFDLIQQIETAADILITTDETKRKYVSLAATTERAYNAILPDEEAETYTAQINLFIEIAKVIYSNSPDPDISGLMENVTDILDSSIKVKSYIVRKIVDEGSQYVLPERIDLSLIDYDRLAADFETNERKHIKFDQLRGRVASKLQHMLQINRSRINFKDEFQRIIDEYNQGSANLELTYYKLLQFTKTLQQEEERSTAEQLTEEQLSVYDILIPSTITLSNEAKEQVKIVVRSMIRTLKEVIHLDWRTQPETRSKVSIIIRDNLEDLPETYPAEMRLTLRAELEKYIFNTYDGEKRTIYFDQP